MREGSNPSTTHYYSVRDVGTPQAMGSILTPNTVRRENAQVPKNADRRQSGSSKLAPPVWN
jgi:hypothetical protein